MNDSSVLHGGVRSDSRDAAREECLSAQHEAATKKAAVSGLQQQLQSSQAQLSVARQQLPDLLRELKHESDARARYAWPKRTRETEFGNR